MIIECLSLFEYACHQEFRKSKTFHSLNQKARRSKNGKCTSEDDNEDAKEDAGEDPEGAKEVAEDAGEDTCEDISLDARLFG